MHLPGLRMECMFHLDRVSLVVAVAELQFVSESVPQPAPPIVEDAKSTDLLSDRGSQKLNLLVSNLQDFWKKPPSYHINELRK